jgi:peroxiredoxin
MEAYRDQYATLFNNGRKVTVLGISVDADTTLASWARDEDFPVLFASDPGGKVGQLYARTMPRTNWITGHCSWWVPMDESRT